MCECMFTTLGIWITKLQILHPDKEQKKPVILWRFILQQLLDLSLEYNVGHIVVCVPQCFRENAYLCSTAGYFLYGVND